MKRIVAAPTAGACGVLPAVLITYEQFYKIPEAKMLEGMYIAAGVGQVIAERACIAGAQGGCQAEIGSASCMAAAAITYIRGGSTKQVFDAGAFALKSLLGLVCDPLGGLVEVPCIKRNGIFAQCTHQQTVHECFIQISFQFFSHHKIRTGIRNRSRQRACKVSSSIIIYI